MGSIKMFQLLNNRLTFKELKYDDKNICWRICFMILHFYILHMTARSQLASWPDSKIYIAYKFDGFFFHFFLLFQRFFHWNSFPFGFCFDDCNIQGKWFSEFIPVSTGMWDLVCPTPRQDKVLFSKEWPMVFRKLDKNFIS